MRLRRTLALAGALIAGGTALAGAAPRDAGTRVAAAPVPRLRPAEASFVRGVALGLFATDPEWDYGPMVDEIRARGASEVLVVINVYQTDRFASDVGLRPGRSPSLPTIERTLAQVRARGMAAALMPVVTLARREAGDWRGRISPADGLDAWFGAYRAVLLPLAELAERAAVSRLVIGSELNSLQGYESRWRGLISETRMRYHGALLYSTNWDRIDDVRFWDALDQVGVTGYFPLAETGADTSVATLVRAWREPQAQLQALSRRLGRPVLITELGYPSQPGAAARPWDDAASSVVDLELQRRLYEGFCSAFDGAQYLSGFYAWNWFGFGGPRDAGYSLRGKPAAAALETCFERAWQPPGVTKPASARAGGAS